MYMKFLAYRGKKKRNILEAGDGTISLTEGI